MLRRLLRFVRPRPDPTPSPAPSEPPEPSEGPPEADSAGAMYRSCAHCPRAGTCTLIPNYWQVIPLCPLCAAKVAAGQKPP